MMMDVWDDDVIIVVLVAFDSLKMLEDRIPLLIYESDKDDDSDQGPFFLLFRVPNKTM